MKTISLTRGLVALVDDEDFEALNQFKWYALSSGTGPIYAVRKCKSRVLLMHREILFPKGSKLKTDHKNGNSLDNRRENLRPATDQQNQRSFLSPRKNKTSRFRGVHLHRASSGNTVWGAQICLSGKQTWLGSFKTEELAAHAYDAAAKKHFGEFASLNFNYEKI